MSVTVRATSACRVSVIEHDHHVGDARLARVLVAVRVLIHPDVVADGARLQARSRRSRSRRWDRTRARGRVLGHVGLALRGQAIDAGKVVGVDPCRCRRRWPSRRRKAAQGSLARIHRDGVDRLPWPSAYRSCWSRVFVEQQVAEAVPALLVPPRSPDRRR